MGIFSTIGKALGSATGSQFLGAGLGAVNSLFNNSMSLSNAKKLMSEQQKYWQQQYDIQRKDSLSDYATQRADYVSDLLASRSRDVEALKNAGLSPALAANQSVGGNSLGATIQQSNGSGVSTSAPVFQSDLQQSSLFALQRKQLEANIKKTDAEANKTMTENEKVRAEFDNWKDNLSTINEQLKADLAKTWSEKAKTDSDKAKAESDISKVSAEIDKIFAEIDSITFNTYKARSLMPYEMSEISANIQKLLSSANKENAESVLTNVKTQFARMGIGVGDGFVQQIAALLASGDATIYDKVKGTLLDLVDKLGTDFKPISDDVKDALNGESIPFTPGYNKKREWISNQQDSINSEFRAISKRLEDSHYKSHSISATQYRSEYERLVKWKKSEYKKLNDVTSSKRSSYKHKPFK